MAGLFADKGLIDRRLWIIFCLSVSSALPFALSGSTLQAWFTVSGVDLMQIGLLTLVGQPYVFKCVWAPLLDQYFFARLGRRRSWMYCSQIGVTLTLVVMAYLNPSHSPGLLATMAMLLAFCSATQDIAIDAFRVESLDQAQRPLGATLTSFGGRVGLLVSTGFALVLAHTIGWKNTYLLMAAFMFVFSLITLSSKEEKVVHQPIGFRYAVILPLKQLFSKNNAIMVLAFVLLYKFCDAFALSMNTVFLIRGMGFSLLQVGAVSKVSGMSGALLGSLVGGLWLSRIRLFTGLWIFGIGQMLSNALFLCLIMIGKSVVWMGVVMFLEYFMGGLATVAFVVYLMGLCDVRYTATQYAMLSGLSACTRVFTGPFSAWVVQSFGWISFFIIACLFGLPALYFLRCLNKRHHFSILSS